MKRENGKRVAVYCRVSTTNDLQDGSFEMQASYYTSLVNSSPGMVLVGIYGDHGKSGRSIMGRPEFQRMLSDCEAGKIDLILTKSVSRFARNLMECVATIRHLKDLGVEVSFEREGFVTDCQYNEMFLSILAAIAQEESRSLANNIRWSRTRRNRVGEPVDAPSYGYRRMMPGHEWRIEAQEAERVRLAFHMACCGYNYSDIRQALQCLERREHTEKVWNQTAVTYMLTNISYTGDYLTNKNCFIETERGWKHMRNDGYVDQYYIEGHHEPIVSHAVFEAVQVLIERHLLFTGKTRYSDEDVFILEESCRLAVAQWGNVVLPEEMYADADKSEKGAEYAV